jgi:hypothetical protein
VDYDFTVTNEGLVDVTVDDNLRLLSEALKDSIGTRSATGRSFHLLDRSRSHVS